MPKKEPNNVAVKMKSKKLKCANIKYFLVLVSLTVATQGVVVSGFLSSFLTTIEKRYGLSSTQVSLISVGYDVASIFTLVPVSYYGGRGNKPKWIAVGALTMGIGSFMFTLPHFLETPYRNKGKEITNDLCIISNVTSTMLTTSMYRNRTFSYRVKTTSTHQASTTPRHQASTSFMNKSSISSTHQIQTSSHQTSTNFMQKSQTYSHQSSSSTYQTKLLDHKASDECLKKAEDTSNYLYLTIMILANMCHSFGSTPLYTIAISYIDENTSVDQSPMYFALYYSMTMVGPAIGYITGGALLRIYIDFGRVDISKITITHHDPDWLGAWWLGFIITGCIFITLSIPLSLFPKHLPNYFVFLKTKIQRKSVSSLTKEEEETSIFEALKRLLTNSIYNFINMSGIAEGSLVAGFVIFAPKYVEAAYHVPATAAGQIIGLATIPSGCFGMLLGGYIVKRYNMTVEKSLGFSKICVATAFFLAFGFLIICPEIKHAGINHPYSVNSEEEITSVNITSECNINCSCSLSKADFVCGEDGLTYISACHAGCLEMTNENNETKLPLKLVYKKCACVRYNLQRLGKQSTNYVAHDGLCAQDCYMIAVFLVFYSATIFVVFIIWTPIITSTIHIVPEKHKSIALAVQWMVARIFGMIPARVLFGKIIDNTCIFIHYDKCGQIAGACPIYGSRLLSTYFMGIMLSLKFLSFISLFFASMQVNLKPSLGTL